jgi:hypothetical protein
MINSHSADLRSEEKNKRETMEFEEFMRKMTKSVKAGNSHILAFMAYDKELYITCLGRSSVITEAVADAIEQDTDTRNIIKDAIDLIESRKMKVTEIDNEDQMNDYLIDLHLNNKDLNNGGQGL